jgi:HemX protein
VAWITDHVLFGIAVAFYGVSGLYLVTLWREGFRRQHWTNYWLLLGGFVFHTLAMLQRGYPSAQCPVRNLCEAVMFIGWVIVVACLGLGLWPRLRFLGAFASPLLFAVGVFGLFPDLDQAGPKLPMKSASVSLHATWAFLAYGAFGISAVAAVMFLVQDHDLKFRKLRAVLTLMPSLERLEQVLSRWLLVGLVLLTAGLAITPYLMQQQQTADPARSGSLFKDAKVWWSFLVWLLYVSLALLRWKWGFRGRRMAWSVVGSFAFVLLTFWGTQLLSPLHRP